MPGLSKKDRMVLLAKAQILQNITAMACLLQKRKRRRPPKARRLIWSREWLLRRPIQGQYAKLMEELRAEDQTGFKNYMRMSPVAFEELLRHVGPRLFQQCYKTRDVPSNLV